METWKDIFINQIPQDRYTVELSNGEKYGLRIMLNGEANGNNVLLDFGPVSSYRLFDEGILLSGNHFSQMELEKYKNAGFQSTIYEIKNGDFSKFINDISNGLFGIYNMKHFVIITLNYVIEVASSFEPIIKRLNVRKHKGHE